MGLNDDDYVREQYHGTEKLDMRSSVWHDDVPGQSPQDVALEAVRECAPQHVLEVGAGKGLFAARLKAELGCEVIATDSSPAMIAASRALAVDAHEADVRNLPFENATFDVVVAAWMLYHVNPVDQALREIVRVLRRGARLVAVTNGRDHLAELWNLVQEQHEEPPFSVENGEAQLRPHFELVEKRNVETHALFPDRNAAANYLRSVNREDLVERLPTTGWPRRARGSTTVFVAIDPIPQS